MSPGMVFERPRLCSVEPLNCLSTHLGRRFRMGGMRILLAEDEHALGEWLSKALEQSGFRVDWRDDGRLVEQALQEDDYDAVVLDLGLPGRDGHEVLKRLRERRSPVPVLVLTARDSLAERVTSLHEGADDFLPKPFALAELEARLSALIRRSRGSERPRLSCGPLQYDTAQRQFTLIDEVLQLSPREHALMRALIARSGQPPGMALACLNC